MTENLVTERRRPRHATPLPLRWALTGLSHLAPPVAARLAGELFGRPRHGRRTQGELAVLAKASPFRVDFRGGELAAWSWGDGPTVLLHHGWGGRGSQLAAFVDPLLEAGYGVVCFDAPAHGDSTGRTTNLPEMSRAVETVVRRLGGVEGVVAHSLGSAACALAMGRGAAIGRAVFLAPPSNMGYYSELFIRHTGFTPRVQRMMESRFHRLTGIHMDELRAPRLAGDQTAPLLVVYDRQDRDVPAEQVEALVEAWEGARLWRTEGLGHKRILVDREVVARAIGFLSATRPAPTTPVPLDAPT